MKKNVQINKILNYKELIIIGVIFIIIGLFVPNFFTYANFFSLVGQISILSLFAFGVTFPGLLKEFDLSVGATAGLCSTLFVVLNNFGIGLGPAIILAIISSLICGLLNGFLIVEIGLSAIIATIGTGFLFNAFELILNGGRRVGASDAVRAIGNLSLGPIPFNFIFSLLILIILYFVSMWTITGRLIYATGENKIASRFSGIRVNLYGYLCFLGAALLGTFGGILEVAYTGTAQIAGGDKFLWDAFIAYFIGISLFRGKRNFVGTYAGVILTIVIGQVLVLTGVPYYNVQLWRAIILILAIIFSTLTTSSSLKMGKKNVS